jgi:hypothetical protein
MPVVRDAPESNEHTPSLGRRHQLIVAILVLPITRASWYKAMISNEIHPECSSPAGFCRLLWRHDTTTRYVRR